MDADKARALDELLLAAVGRLTVSWAHLEFAIDCMIALIHRTMDGSLHEPRLPRVLSRKIEYLRAAFKRLGIPESDLPRYDAFLDDINAESVTRHDIIHGFPIHHPSDEGEAKLIRLIIHKTHWEQKPIAINIASVTEAHERAMKLANKAMNWTRFMLEQYDKHQAQARPRDEGSA